MTNIVIYNSETQTEEESGSVSFQLTQRNEEIDAGGSLDRNHGKHLNSQFPSIGFFPCLPKAITSIHSEVGPMFQEQDSVRLVRGPGTFAL